MEGERWRNRGEGGGGWLESWMLVALCIVMFSLLRLREAASSQDLNVSIIHEVVLRYANMNYLTSRADPLLHRPPPTPHFYLCTSPPLTLLYSYTFSENLNLLSERRRLFLGTPSLNNLGLSGFLSLPLSPSLCAPSVSAPL